MMRVMQCIEISVLGSVIAIVSVASLLGAEVGHALFLLVALGAYLINRIQFWINQEARKKEWESTRKHQERVEKLLGELAAGDGTKRKE